MTTVERKKYAIAIIEHHLSDSPHRYAISGCSYKDAVSICGMVDRRLDTYGIIDAQCDMSYKDGIARFDIC